MRSKQRTLQNVLNNLNVSKALVVLADNDANVVLSARNIPDVITALPNTINVYDVLKYNTVIVNKSCCSSNRGGIRIMANVKYYDVILKPVVTEKSMAAMGEKKYTFLVHTDANKTMIKEAVEKMFEGTKVKCCQHNELRRKEQKTRYDFWKNC